MEFRIRKEGNWYYVEYREIGETEWKLATSCGEYDAAFKEAVTLLLTNEFKIKRGEV